MVWPRLRLTYQRGSPRVGRRRTTVVNRSESGSPATPTGVRTNRFFPSRALLPNWQSIETAAGKITREATVRSTRYRGIEAVATAITWTSCSYSLQVAGRHSDRASHCERSETPVRTTTDVHHQHRNL